jgi:hypothetical protein
MSTNKASELEGIISKKSPRAKFIHERITYSYETPFKRRFDIKP